MCGLDCINITRAVRSTRTKHSKLKLASSSIGWEIKRKVAKDAHIFSTIYRDNDGKDIGLRTVSRKLGLRIGKLIAIFQAGQSIGMYTIKLTGSHHLNLFV